MKTTADYLDELRAHFGARSDYALQNFTGWHINQISRYRHKKSTFDDDTAAKVAGWIGAPLERVLIDMNAQRARSPEVKKAWLKAAGALVAVLAAVQLAHFAPVDFWQLDQTGALFFGFTANTYYTHIAIAAALVAGLALYRVTRRKP